MIFIILVAIMIILLSIGYIKAKKSWSKLLFGSAALFMGLLVCLAVGFIYVTEYKIMSVDSQNSIDGRYKILMEEVGEPDFPFGRTHGQLILYNDKKKIACYRFDIANDGCRLGKNQWVVEWKEDGVEVVLSGDEQMDFWVLLGYNGEIESRYLDTIYGMRKEDRTRLIHSNIEFEKGENDSVKNESNVDVDGYPVSKEWQGYKEQMRKVACEINIDTEFEIEYFVTAKGYPYAVIFRQKDEESQNITEQRLILNENYTENFVKEYVLEEFYFTEEGVEVESPRILNFYLIDCNTLEVTDENRTDW